MTLSLLFTMLLVVWFVYRCHKSHVANWGPLWLNLIDGLIRIFCRRYHRFAYEAVPIPRQGPALLVSNHVSGLDPFLMIAACPRPIRFLIAREQYNRLGLRWLFRASGCIPVDRSGRIEKAFRTAVNALHAGEIVALFPEGGIHPLNKPPKSLKRGVAKLAELTQAPVYPVHLEGIKGEGHMVLAVLLRSQARLYTYPPLNCGQLSYDECLANIAEILNKNRKVTT